MFCILVISENNNNPGLFCTLPALISRFFKWTEIKFILSRDTQKHLTFYSKFIPVLLRGGSRIFRTSVKKKSDRAWSAQDVVDAEGAK